MVVSAIEKRRSMRLKQFDYESPGAYFATICTKEKKSILSAVVRGDINIAPYVRLTPVGRIVEKYLLSTPGLDHYVIMPNHVHIILNISATDILQGPMWASAPTTGSVSNRVRTLKTLVTKELGYSIWQRSFYDHVIRNEADYLRIARYIEDNPAKWSDDTYYIAD